MTTSNSIDFNVTRNDLIRDAMLEVGALDIGTDPTDNEVTDCARRLNIMVKSWNRNPYLYTRDKFQLTITPGTESYTIGTGGTFNQDRPVRITSVMREDSNGNEIPVEIVPWSRYESQPVKNTQAPVNILHYDPQLELGRIYVWPTGSTGNVLLNVTAQRQIEDFDTSSDNPDVPKECYLALYLNLAVNIWRMFNPSEMIPQDLVMLAKNALYDWESGEEEKVSVNFAPEMG